MRNAVVSSADKKQLSNLRTRDSFHAALWYGYASVYCPSLWPLDVTGSVYYHEGAGKIDIDMLLGSLLSVEASTKQPMEGAYVASSKDDSKACYEFSDVGVMAERKDGGHSADEAMTDRQAAILSMLHTGGHLRDCFDSSPTPLPQN
tara:strand:+ start:27925 stop:28365 length:441 start_codon:yes stop_codon:yes gene_type:complete